MRKYKQKRFIFIFATAVVLFLFGRGPSDAAYGPFTDNGDGTVSDAGTGLVWQQIDSGRGFKWDAGCQLCETLELAGFDDWRMPRVDELRTLVDYQLIDPAAIEMFQAHQFSYWTDTGVFGDPSQAWVVSFFSGIIVPSGTGDSHYVRCVRGGPNWPDNLSERLVIESDEVVIDTTTNLSWQRVDGGPGRDWNAAAEYCEALILDEYDDWRLPEIEELQSIVDYTGDDPSAGPEFFNSVLGEYWSHTLKAGDESTAWSVYFPHGLVEAYHAIGYSGNIYTRCVRGDFEIFIDEPPPPEPEFDGVVLVDIKPRGCKNRLNVRAKGFLRVAILGTDTFDVASIDPASVRLEGVAPRRATIKDLSAPVDPISQEGICLEQCLPTEPDGFPDLILRFRKQAIVKQLGEVDHDECLVLTLTGARVDGTPIEGEDVVRIIKRKKKK